LLNQARHGFGLRHKFRFGFLEIGEPDFALIAKRMLPNVRTFRQRGRGGKGAAPRVGRRQAEEAKL
jgi:hypothetical protein